MPQKLSYEKASGLTFTAMRITFGKCNIRNEGREVACSGREKQELNNQGHVTLIV